MRGPEVEPWPVSGVSMDTPHNPCTEGPSVCIQGSLEGCYSRVPPPPGIPLLGWARLWPLLPPGSCLPLPEVIAMFAAPFLVWKDVEAGEAGEKAVLTGCDQPLLQSRVSEGRASWPRGLCLASAPHAPRPPSRTQSRPPPPGPAGSPQPPDPCQGPLALPQPPTDP